MARPSRANNTSQLFVKIVYSWDGTGIHPLNKVNNDRYRVQVMPLDQDFEPTNDFQVIGMLHAVAQWLVAVSDQPPMVALWSLRSATTV